MTPHTPARQVPQNARWWSLLGWVILGLSLLGALFAVHVLSLKINEELNHHGDAIYGTARIRAFEAKFRALLLQIELDRRDGRPAAEHILDVSKTADRGTVLFSAFVRSNAARDVTGRVAYIRAVPSPEGLAAGNELLALWTPLEQKIRRVVQQSATLDRVAIAEAVQTAEQSSGKFIALSERLAREEDQYHRSRLGWLSWMRNVLGFYFAATAGLLIPVVIFKGRMEKLRESEMRFRKLFEDSAEAILIIEDDVFVECNQAALAMLRLTDPKLVLNIPPKSLSPEFQPDGRRSDEKAAELIAQAFERGSNLFEWEHLRADGEPFMAEVLLTPIVDKDRHRLHVVWRDITERKQAEQLQLKLMGELERSNRELEQFAYIASHDLQEPLRMVVSYTQLLSERYKGRLDEKADKFIGYAVDGVKRMQNLIHDLLAYARVQQASKPQTEVNTADLVRDATQNLSVAIESSRTMICVGELPVIRGDPVLLLQVFQNLIGNAVKFSDKTSPRVEISAVREAGEWIFSVRDNGIGIDPQFHSRIFGIFQRLHDRSKYQGTGIGLAVVKKIIEQFNGRIWVESSLGKGACFRFTLPEGDL